jgi:hypothetical protein
MGVLAARLSGRLANVRGVQSRMGEPHRPICRTAKFQAAHSADGCYPDRDQGRTRRRAGRPTCFFVGSSLKSRLSARVVVTRLEGRGDGVHPGHGSGLNLPAHRSSWCLRAGTAPHRDCIGNCSLCSYSRHCQSHYAKEIDPGRRSQKNEGVLTANHHP